jgi:NHL repeat
MSRTSLSLLALLAAAILASGTASAQSVGFASKPRMTGANGKRAISFSVSEPTDVEVAILDNTGKVVRHLAAGFLGGKAPPPPPLRPGLTQSVEWDGKDDGGKTVAGGRARVRLGLKPEFSHLIGGDPGRHLGVTGLGCGPNGNLYVQSFSRAPSSHYVHSEIKAYDRDGKPLRQIMPYSAKLPAEKRKATKWIKIAGGHDVPMIYHGSAKNVFPEMGAGGVNILVRKDGKLMVRNGGFRDKPHFRQRILLLGPDGSTDDDYKGPTVGVSGLSGMQLMALAPDGKKLYLSGFRQGKTGVSVPKVFQTEWGSKEAPREFLSGSELDEPRGVAVDAKGNLYVADHGKGCVSVFSAAGKKIGSLPAKHADLVAVHPRTGAVYVMCTSSDPKKNRTRKWTSGSNYRLKTLLKFSGRQAAKPTLSMSLLKRSSPARPKMALDASGKQAVIWVAGLRWGGGRIRKIVDGGDKFKEVAPAMYASGKGAVRGGYLDIAVAYERDTIYVSAPPRRNDAGIGRYDGKTGKFLGRYVLKPRIGRGAWGQPALSWDEKHLLFLNPMQSLARFTVDGKPANWAGSDKHLVNGMQQGFIRPRGHCAAPDGGAYVLHHPKFRGYGSGLVSRVGPDGKVTSGIVKLDCPVGGVKVDSKGNIYVGAFVAPKGTSLPGCFEGKLAGTVKKGQKFFYSNLYGTLLKFKPAGGSLTKGEGNLTAGVSFKRHPVKADGLIWSHYGLSPMPSRFTGCSCQTARFDVDRWGRVFLPDALRFSIQVLDSNGGHLTRFGQYGNVDDAIGATKVKGKAAPIYNAWPHQVVVTDTMAYIADMVNHQIVAVKLNAVAEESLSLR